MLKQIEYRGPDEFGIQSNSLLTFGHRRLSIIDLKGGKQPCVDGQGNMLSFNGEIYGYKQLAVELRQQGVRLASQSDTDVLFSLLKQSGVSKTLEKIDGMFAFSFYAKNQNKLYLVRDRFGEKPLFYSYKNNQLIFASEIKAMRQHPLLQQSSLDAGQASSFLTLEYMPDSMSGYEAIKKLLPGHYLCLDLEKNDISIKQYNRVNISVSSRNESEEEKIEQLKQYLSESVKQRLVADVPVGLFLSGGLDSSLIAAIAQQHSDNINSYTIKMPGTSFDESPYAEVCAKALDLRHTTIELSPHDVLSGVDALVENLDEPLADSSLIPSALLCKYTRQNVKVAIGGDGADELFAGYPNFQAQQLAPLMSCIPKGLGTVLRRSLDYLPVSDSYMSYSFKLKQLSYGFGLPVEQQSVSWMSAWFVDEQRSLWQSGHHNTINAGLSDLLNSLKRESNSNHRINQLLYIFTHTYLPDDILVKMDRASMYSSLEVRSPFLDKNFTDYVFGLPQNDKLRLFKGKYLLRKLAKSYLPDSILQRKKHGFAFPISEYIRTHLKERVGDTILNRTNPIMDWFDFNYINTCWKEHQSMRRDHGKKLWALYILMNVAKN